MIDLAALASAVHLLGSSWQPWLVVIPGILIGLIVHAVPGPTTSMALAICLPQVASGINGRVRLAFALDHISLFDPSSEARP